MSLARGCLRWLFNPHTLSEQSSYRAGFKREECHTEALMQHGAWTLSGIELSEHLHVQHLS